MVQAEITTFSGHRKDNWGEPGLCREILSERKKRKERRKGRRTEEREERKQDYHVNYCPDAKYCQFRRERAQRNS